MTAAGLTLAELRSRTGEPLPLLERALAGEVRHGRVLLEGDRYRLAPTFPAELRDALSSVTRNDPAAHTPGGLAGDHGPAGARTEALAR